MEGEQIKMERQACEVYSRIVGYIRPVDQWNPGKQSEFKDRQVFNTCACAVAEKV
jgi:ribonucleoside-triphosphate reductase